VNRPAGPQFLRQVALKLVMGSPVTQYFSSLPFLDW
jgi:hypothetical protein